MTIPCVAGGNPTLASWQTHCGGGGMAILLLALFPVLLLYRPRYGFVAIAVAIVLLYRQNTKRAVHRVRRKYDDEANNLV